MSSTPRRLFPSALVSLGVLLAGAALAWACSPQAGISISTNQGPPGTSINVTGTKFEEGGPVEIYWNGSGSSMLARATGPDFSVPVTIPNAPPDTYTVFAVGKSANGTVAGRASASFTIPGEDEPAPTPGATPSPGGRAESSPSSGTTTGRETSSSGSTTRSATGGNGARARGESRTAAGAPGSARTPEGVTTLPSGTAVFADSVTSPDAAREVARRTRSSERGSDRSPAAASQRSAAGDLWAGFRPDEARGILGGSSTPPEASGSVPTFAAVLLALGALSVLAGIAVAGTRRRRRAGSGAPTRIDAD